VGPTTDLRFDAWRYSDRMVVEAIRSAFESLGDGDVEPLVSLIHPDMEWRGRRRLSRFWQPPS